MFLKRESRAPKTVAPPAVASLDMTGSVNDDRAVLTAKFVVQNPEHEEFVPLHLGLHEAILRDWTYEGPGQLLSKPNDRAQGSTWWLRGAGKHFITLEFNVPVRKQVANRRLQLTLPEATVSRMKLATEYRGISAKASSGELQVTNSPEQTSQIELLGLGPRLELSWQPIVVDSPTTPLLESEMTILAHAASEKLLLEVHQRLQVLQGSVSEIKMRLPANAELLSVEGRDYRAHRVVAEDPGKVFVQLTAPSSGQIQLKWTLRLPPADGGKFVLEGFQVEQARKQSGQIGLIPVESLRLSLSQADHPQLLRINATELRPLSAQVTRAYRFFSQPFRIVIHVERVEPYFTVEPRLTLNITQDELVLDGVFSIRILRGDVQSLEMRWPNWKTDGWEPQGDLIAGIDAVENQPERLRLRLTDDHGEEFVVRLRARRPIRAGDTVSVALPQLIASDTTPAQLKIVEAENLTCDVVPIGETVLDLRPDTHLPRGDQTAESTLGSRVYRVLSDEQLISLRPVRQQRRVDLASETNLQWNQNRLRAVQRLQYDVKYERLAQAKLVMPGQWGAADVHCRMDGDRPIPLTWLPGEIDGTTVALATFPEPRLGEFRLELLFDVPLTDEMLAGESPVDLPIISDQDVVARQIELHTSSANDFQFTVTDAGWKPRAEALDETRWMAEGVVTSARLRLDNRAGQGQQFSITDADFHAEWDRVGAARCVASFRLAGRVSRLQLVMPSEATLLDVRYDDRLLNDAMEAGLDGRSRTYSLRVRSDNPALNVHRLTVHYRLPSKSGFGPWNQRIFTVPTLPQGRWTGQANWRLSFPGDQHLFAFSEEVTPLFEWHRTGVFWSRVSPPGSPLPGESTASGADPSRGPGNVYAFSQYGEPREFSFSTMSGPMILLVGASISLMVGFLAWNLALFRQALTVWAGTFVIALLGLWFRPQLEILLQPILIGFSLPLIAVWVQGLRRRDVPPVLSFDPLMDLEESRSSVVRSRFSESRSDLDSEPIKLPTGSTHDFLRTESRSGVS